MRAYASCLHTRAGLTITLARHHVFTRALARLSGPRPKSWSRQYALAMVATGSPCISLYEEGSVTDSIRTATEPASATPRTPHFPYQGSDGPYVCATPCSFCVVPCKPRPEPRRPSRVPRFLSLQFLTPARHPLLQLYRCMRAHRTLPVPRGHRAEFANC